MVITVHTLELCVRRFEIDICGSESLNIRGMFLFFFGAIGLIDVKKVTKAFFTSGNQARFIVEIESSCTFSRFVASLNQ